MRILFVAAEATPFAKVGGLGDVVGALPWELARLEENADVRVVLPLHTGVDRRRWGLKPLAAFTVSHRNGPIIAQVYKTEYRGLPVYFISGAPILAAPGIYSPDPHADAIKYAFFSLAALALSRYLDWAPDVLHAHDWHTALSVYALAHYRAHNPFFAKTRTIFTVHNLPYMGAPMPLLLEAFGLPPAGHESGLPEWARSIPLPLGIAAADVITTVSPTYAREIQTPAFGHGLEEFLRRRAQESRLLGILNGLDYEVWDPQNDAALNVRYSAETLTLRPHNTAALRTEVGLPEPTQKHTPLLGVVSRLTYQKGVDLIADTLRSIADRPWQAVLLGTGEPHLEAELRRLQAEFPERVRAILRYDDALARRIYAGADALLLPSRYEPCGLAQMIAMRYGAVPIAHETGGLADTVADYDIEPRSGTGFLFPRAEAKSLAFAIRRASGVFACKNRWRAVQRRGMKRDFSWQTSAKQYLRLYKSLLRQSV